MGRLPTRRDDASSDAPIIKKRQPVLPLEYALPAPPFLAAASTNAHELHSTSREPVRNPDRPAERFLLGLSDVLSLRAGARYSPSISHELRLVTGSAAVVGRRDPRFPSRAPRP